MGGDGGCSSYSIRPSWRNITDEDLAATFGYVRAMLTFSSQVKGANNKARFSFWTGLHQLMEAQAIVQVAWGRFNHSLVTAEQLVDGHTYQSDAEGATSAVEQMLALRITMVNATTVLMRHLMSSVTSTGSLGTLSDFSQRGLPYMFEQYNHRIEKLLGTPLPVAAQVPRTYQGVDRLWVLSPRPSISAAERYNITALAFTRTPITSSVCHWRRVTGHHGAFQTQTMAQVPGRQVFQASLSLAHEAADSVVEWFVAARSGASTLSFPPNGTFTVTVVALKSDDRDGFAGRAGRRRDARNVGGA